MDEFAAILDDGMLIIVDWPYIRNNEHWYTYIGHTRTANSIIHTYVITDKHTE